MKLLGSYNNFFASKYILSALLLTLPPQFYFSDLQLKTLSVQFCFLLLQVVAEILHLLISGL